MEKRQSPQFREMGLVVLMLLCLTTTVPTSVSIQQGGGAEELVSSQPRKWQDRVIEVKGGPESVVWIVQLSDLHFSVHHPERALDFKKIVGPALKMINPSLVLITGDLTGIIICVFYFSFVGEFECLLIPSFIVFVESWDLDYVKCACIYRASTSIPILENRVEEF
jgi:hypothetical protein